MPAPSKTPTQFLQLRSGAVFAYAPELAKAPGAFKCSAQVAADYFRSMGAENAVTKAYPPVEDLLEGADADTPEAAPKPKPKAKPRAKRKAPETEAIPASGMVMSDTPLSPDDLKKLVSDDGVSDGS